MSASAAEKSQTKQENSAMNVLERVKCKEGDLNG